jgi:hypothetical protein
MYHGGGEPPPKPWEWFGHPIWPNLGVVQPPIYPTWGQTTPIEFYFFLFVFIFFYIFQLFVIYAYHGFFLFLFFRHD